MTPAYHGHMRTMTVAIPSYQRRESLRRLLDSICAQVEEDPALAEDLDIMVVLDGSDDGSREMLEAYRSPVPLTWEWQENAGQAAARNSMIRRAGGDLIWFLDDDMVLGEDALARHRSVHDESSSALVMGPCHFPAAADIVGMTRSWAERLYADLAERGFVTDPHAMSFANTSGPVQLFRRLDGFDTGFRGWGGEDVELGIRVLEAGISVRFDPSAVVWHHQARGIVEMLRTKVDEGRNAVVIADLHPEMAGHVLPSARGPKTRLILRLVRLLGPRLAGLLARALAHLAAAEDRLAPWGARPVFDLAVIVSTFAGAISHERGRVLLRRSLSAP